MKLFIVVVTCLILTSALAACGGGDAALPEYDWDAEAADSMQGAVPDPEPERPPGWDGGQQGAMAGPEAAGGRYSELGLAVVGGVSVPEVKESLSHIVTGGWSAESVAGVPDVGLFEGGYVEVERTMLGDVRSVMLFAARAPLEDAGEGWEKLPAARAMAGFAAYALGRDLEGWERDALLAAAISIFPGTEPALLFFGEDLLYLSYDGEELCLRG